MTTEIELVCRYCGQDCNKETCTHDSNGVLREYEPKSPSQATSGHYRPAQPATETQGQHTPKLPLACGLLSETEEGVIRVYAGDEEGLHVADFYSHYTGDDETSQKFAEDCVRKINSHAQMVDSLRELTTAAAALDNRLHAGFKLSELSAEQSRVYNAVNNAKAVLALAATD